MIIKTYFYVACKCVYNGSTHCVDTTEDMSTQLHQAIIHSYHPTIISKNLIIHLLHTHNHHNYPTPTMACSCSHLTKNPVLNTWIVTLSNLAALPAIFTAFYHDKYIDSLLLFFAMMSSIMHHTTTTQRGLPSIVKFGIAAENAWLWLDRIFAASGVIRLCSYVYDSELYTDSILQMLTVVAAFCLFYSDVYLRLVNPNITKMSYSQSNQSSNSYKIQYTVTHSVWHLLVFVCAFYITHTVVSI
jgi:hypothetical protein